MKRLAHVFPLSFTALAVALFLLGGCDAVGPSSSQGEVKVGFKIVHSSSAKSVVALAQGESDELVLSGSNGTLKLTDIRLIVSGLELEGEADGAEFEASPSFLNLPLDATEIAPVAVEEVPSGRYSEFEFEVENVDLGEADEEAEGENDEEEGDENGGGENDGEDERDEEEEDEDDQLRDLRDTIRKEFPSWPDEASMVAVGTFTPDGGQARSFTTYFEAEIEVERELDPALVVDGDGFSRTLTVKLDPSRWFGSSGDTVKDLSQFDFSSTGQLVELEFEDGVLDVESDDGHDGGEDEDEGDGNEDEGENGEDEGDGEDEADGEEGDEEEGDENEDEGENDEEEGDEEDESDEDEDGGDDEDEGT